MPPLAVLAGGLATRMRPLTEKIPKSMLEVAGEPFIAHQLRLFRRKGIENVVICAGYLGTMIEDFVGDGARFGLSVRFSFDGDRLLGTGGALKKALPMLDESFMVVYGDSWLDTDYAAVAEAFHTAGKSGLMTVFRNENAWDTSNVEFEGDVIQNYDKKNLTPRMAFIDWGMSVLKAGIFASWSATELFDLADLFSKLVRDGDMAGYEVKQRFYEIGSHAGLRETSELLAGPQEH